MRLTAMAAMFALLLWSGPPAFANCISADSDGDGVFDCEDNCIDAANPAQDDTDGDSCGNVCDADFDQDSIVGFSDFGSLQKAIGSTNSNADLTEPIGDTITMADYDAFSARYNNAPGPSGTTSGTPACPL